MGQQTGSFVVVEQTTYREPLCVEDLQGATLLSSVRSDETQEVTSYANEVRRHERRVADPVSPGDLWVLVDW